MIKVLLFARWATACLGNHIVSGQGIGDDFSHSYGRERFNIKSEPSFSVSLGSEAGERS